MRSTLHRSEVHVRSRREVGEKKRAVTSYTPTNLQFETIIVNWILNFGQLC